MSSNSDKYYKGAGSYAFTQAKGQKVSQLERERHHEARNEVLRNPWLVKELVMWGGDVKLGQNLEQARLSNSDIRMGLDLSAAKRRIGMSESLKEEIASHQRSNYIVNDNPESYDGMQWTQFREGRTVWYILQSTVSAFGEPLNAVHAKYYPDTRIRRVFALNPHNNPWKDEEEEPVLIELTDETITEWEGEFGRVETAVYLRGTPLRQYYQDILAVPIPHHYHRPVRE